MNRKASKTRALCEAAAFICLAQILSYIRLYQFPQGGSIDVAMLPIVIFAVRWGVGWGAGAGLVYGTLHYLLGSGFAIDWTTIVMDYMVAFAALGLGAGLFHGKKYGVFWGSITGSLLRFLAHWTVGALVWGKWMPDEFFGMTMTNPWIYSLLYNGPYMLCDLVLICLLAALMYKPLKKYFRAEDLIN